ncbi:Uncharacterised protein [Shigella sonnei]|nr:Uncharacterised protein [Shigella sonnei]
MGSRLTGHCIHNASSPVAVAVRCFERKSHYGFSATLSVVRWSKARHFAATYRVRREQMQMSIPSPLLKAPSLPGQFSCSVSWLILQWLSYFGYCIFRANDETLI